MYTKLSLGSQRRAQFKGRLDNFCRFHWKDEDAFDKFGAFIITDNVGDLKFHSGPTWTNSYSQPQFGESGDLLGVSFSTYSISFKIGLYAISEDQWRQFLNWMSPLTIGWLRLDYAPKWQYQCKVASLAEGSRYVLFSDENGEDLYYCETTVKFDIVGTPIAYSVDQLEFTKDDAASGGSNDNKSYFKLKNTDVSSSDLDYPLDLKLVCDLNDIFNTVDNTILHINASTTYRGISVDLFSITLDNLSYYRAAKPTGASDNDKSWHSKLNLYYSSETGLLFYNFGDSPIKLLSFQESVSTGERLVYSMTSTKFRWPGRFTKTSADTIQDYTINLSAYTNKKGSSDKTYYSCDLYYNPDDNKEATGETKKPATIQVVFSGRSRTNVI